MELKIQVTGILKFGFYERIWSQTKKYILGALAYVVILYLSRGIHWIDYIVLSLPVIFFIRSYTYNKFYIVEISINEDMDRICVDYYRYMEKMPRLEIPVSELQIKITGVENFYPNQKIVFYRKGEEILRQYVVGEWSRDKVKEITDYFNKHNPQCFAKGSLRYF